MPAITVAGLAFAARPGQVLHLDVDRAAGPYDRGGMVFDARVLRVLIASPSDTSSDRDTIERAIGRWNSLNAFSFGIMLLPVRWETDSTPALGDRPQAILNTQIVDECDMLIGAFWTKLGTPTGDAASGTVEEIERIFQAGKPVLLYFCDRPVVPGNIDAHAFEMLNTYRNDMEQRGIVGTYGSDDELFHKVIVDLTRTIRRAFGDEGGADAAAAEPRPRRPSPAAVQDAVIRALRDIYGRFSTAWEAMRQDYNPEEGRFLLQSVLDELIAIRGQLVAGGLADGGADLAEDLLSLVSAARDLANAHFFLDGGRSWGEFQSGTNELMESLQGLVQRLS